MIWQQNRNSHHTGNNVKRAGIISRGLAYARDVERPENARETPRRKHRLFAEKLARNTPTAYRVAPASATIRGPFRAIHNPPKNAAKPSTKMLIVNVRVTWEMLQPNCFDNGTRNTLHA